MEYSGPYCYELQLSGNTRERVISKKTYQGKETLFKKPVTNKLTPKIYVLQHKEEIIYVGYASQSIGKRLGQGLRNSGVNKNLGYKWKHLSEVKLFVFVFNKELKGNNHKDDKPFIALAESVEAELVYLVRQNTGKWPEFQNEIHFNNNQSEKAKEIASQMYNILTA